MMWLEPAYGLAAELVIEGAGPAEGYVAIEDPEECRALEEYMGRIRRTPPEQNVVEQ